MKTTRLIWWRLVSIVFVKEVSDHARDRRSIILSLLFPLLAPVLIGFLLYTVSHANVQGRGQRVIEVPVVGAEYAPRLMQSFRDKGMTLVEMEGEREELRAEVLAGQISFVLVIPESAAGSPTYGIEIITDRTNPRSLADTAQAMRHITGFGRVEAERLIGEAGLDPHIAVPITVSQSNVGRAPSQAYLFYNMIPSMLTFMVFMGAVYLTIDSSVGERERGSLEPLMSAPVARWELLLGKSLAGLLFTMAVVAMNLIAFRFALSKAVEGTTGMAPPPGVEVYVALFLLSIPVAALAVGVQVTIAAITRSAKEAQIYLGLLPTVPLVPGLIMVFNPVPPSVGMAMVPVYGQLGLFLELTNGRSLDPSLVGVSVVSTMIAAGLVFWLASKLFESERMIFGA